MSRGSFPMGALRPASGRVGLAGVLIVGVLAVAFGTGYTATRSLTNDGSVWLRKGNTIAQLNAPSGRLQAAIHGRGGSQLVAAPGDPLQIVQEPDGSVYVAVPGQNRVFKVDLTTMGPGPSTSGNAVLVGGGRAYAINASKGTITPLNPRTALPSRPQIKTGAPIQSAALAGSTAYVAGVDGVVTAVAGDGKRTTTKVGSLGDPLGLAVAGPTATVVDSARGTLQVLGGKSPPAPIHLPGAAGAPVAVAANQPGPDVWLVRDHLLVDVKLRAGQASSLALGAGDRYEPPVVVGNRVYVPDLTSDSVGVYDTSTLQLVHTYPVPAGAPGNPGGIEVVAKDGGVWADNPSSRYALNLSAAGTSSREVDKGTGEGVVDPNAKPAPRPAVPTPVPPSDSGAMGPAIPAPAVPRPAVPSPAVPIPNPGLPTPLLPSPGPVVPSPGPVVPIPGPTGPSPGPVVPSPGPVVPIPGPAGPSPGPTLPSPGPAAGSPGSGPGAGQPPGAGSPGSSKVSVPDVTTQSETQACAAIKAAGLTCSPSDQGPAPSGTLAGQVTKQSPTGGSQAAGGSTVTVDYYGTVAKVSVPAGLAGASPTAACASISQAGLVCVPQGAANAPAGTALNQVTSVSPPSGSSVAPGTSVTINYYSSAAPVLAPNCEGKAISGFSCTAAGITVTTQAQGTSANIACNTTYGQSTPPGQPVAAGSTLVVYYDTSCLEPLYQHGRMYPYEGITYLSTSKSPPSPASDYMATQGEGNVYASAKPGLSALLEFVDYTRDSQSANPAKVNEYYYTTNAGSAPAGFTMSRTVGYVYASSTAGTTPVYQSVITKGLYVYYPGSAGEPGPSTIPWYSP